MRQLLVGPAVAILTLALVGCSAQRATFTGSRLNVCRPMASSHWTRVRSLPHLTSGDLTFWSRCRGVIVGSGFQKATLLTTRDGGHHWRPGRGVGGIAQLTSIGIDRRGHGYAVGSTQDSQWRLLVTSNGGLTWRRARSPSAFSYLGGVAVAPSGDAWIFGAQSGARPALAVRPGSGGDWRYISLPQGLVDITAFSFDNRVWLAGDSKHDAVVLTPSARGSFVVRRIFKNGRLGSLAVGGNRALVGGFRFRRGASREPQAAVLFSSTDRGKSWRPVRVPNGRVITEIAQTPRGPWLLFGKHGLVGNAVLSLRAGGGWVENKIPCRGSCQFFGLRRFGQRLWLLGADGIFVRST